MPKASFGNRLILKGLDCKSRASHLLLLKKIAVESLAVVDGPVTRTTRLNPQFRFCSMCWVRGSVRLYDTVLSQNLPGAIYRERLLEIAGIVMSAAISYGGG
jgi:hypothetical protein